MTLDPVLLSRLQWAWVIAWHILLPAFTVGLASYIAVLEGLYFLIGREIWFRISGFWTRIFAVSFGMGVVSGNHAVPVRHQLEPLHRRCRRRDLATVVLRLSFSKRRFSACFYSDGVWCSPGRIFL